jgi:hypothetical protein
VSGPFGADIDTRAACCLTCGHPGARHRGVPGLPGAGSVICLDCPDEMCRTAAGEVPALLPERTVSQ